MCHYEKDSRKLHLEDSISNPMYPSRARLYNHQGGRSRRRAKGKERPFHTCPSRNRLTPSESKLKHWTSQTNRERRHRNVPILPSRRKRKSPSRPPIWPTTRASYVKRENEDRQQHSAYSTGVPGAGLPTSKRYKYLPRTKSRNNLNKRKSYLQYQARGGVKRHVAVHDKRSSGTTARTGTI